MSDFNAGGLKVTIPDSEIAAQIAALAPAIITPLAQAALQGAVPPEWWTSFPTPPTPGPIIGFKFATPYTARTSISSTSYTSIQTIDYTPVSVDSKILLLATLNTGVLNLNIASFSFFRDSTDLTPSGLDGMMQNRAVSVDAMTTNSLFWVDTPATTSQVTWSLKGKTNNGSAPVWLGGRGADTAVKTVGATFMLFEING